MLTKEEKLGFMKLTVASHKAMIVLLTERITLLEEKLATQKEFLQKRRDALAKSESELKEFKRGWKFDSPLHQAARCPKCQNDLVEGE